MVTIPGFSVLRSEVMPETRNLTSDGVNMAPMLGKIGLKQFNDSAILALNGKDGS